MRNRVDEAAVRALDKEPFMHAVVRDVAELAANIARGDAPVSRDEAPGEYKRGFGSSLEPGARAKATFYNNDPKAWLLEYGAPGRRFHGGKPNPFKPIGVIRSTIRKLGLRFDEGR